MAFVATTQPDIARRFYEDTLGLEFLAYEQYALVFAMQRSTLRITKLSQLDPPPYTVLGWAVTDIEAAVRELAAKGVEFQRYPGFDHNELGIYTFPNGDRVAWFQDPDGNTLSVTQV